MSLLCISEEGHDDLMCPLCQSELQQSLHAAGVLLYVHGGPVSGARQHVQDFVLPFQLGFCLQGEILQLHQHLQTHSLVCLINYTAGLVNVDN